MPQLRERGIGGHVSPRSPHADDFARIFGIETEYGVSVTDATDVCRSNEAAVAMFRPVISRSRSSNAYLSNGARLYLDVGSHPEYATAEARDPRTAMVQDAAGESLMRGLALQAQADLRRSHGSRLLVHVYKNNVDSAGHSFGCHENYLVRRQVSLDMIERWLLPFLITRQLLSGAGRIDGDGFHVSQRAAFLDEAVSSSTTRDRPMVNTRDEPHADPEQFRRLHVILGDSNRSQYMTMMKLALTHLVLCVIEESVRSGEPTGFECCSLADPSEANRAISADGDHCSVRLRLADPSGFEKVFRRFRDDDDDCCGMRDQAAAAEHTDGLGPTALGLQYHYLRVVAAFVRRHGERINADTPGFDADQICRDWRVLLDLLGHGDIEGLADRVDWAAKYRILGRLGHRMSQPSLAVRERFDLDYHDVANGGIYESLVSHGLMHREIDDAVVSAALHEPPMDTRAVLRAGFIARALAKGRGFSCDWTHVALDSQGGSDRRIEAVLLDPFSTQGGEDYRRLMDALR